MQRINSGTERTATILIVEDDGLQALDINEMLQQAGYLVGGTASSAEEAMRFTYASPPALAVIDVSLGTYINGITLARHLHTRYGTRVVFVTGHPEAVIREAPEFQDTLLGKPVRRNQLLKLVEKELSARSVSLSDKR